MTTPSPQLIVLNEADGPGLRILQYCPVCNENITDHPLDVSQFTNTDIGKMLGEADGLAWLDHVAARHGGAS